MPERFIGAMEDAEGRTIAVSIDGNRVMLHAGGDNWREFDQAGLPEFIDLLDTAYKAVHDA